MDVVRETLRDIKADGKPSITVFNKVDKLDAPGIFSGLKERFPQAILISAARGINLGELLSAIQRFAEEKHTIRSFTIRPPDYKILAEFHRETDVQAELFDELFIQIRCDIPPDTAERMLKTHAGRLEETNAGT
jgi:GTP-binding protein HflX